MTYPSNSHTTTPAAANAASGTQCRIELVADGRGFGDVVAFVGRSVS
jgi:hypothetical protein